MDKMADVCLSFATLNEVKGKQSALGSDSATDCFGLRAPAMTCLAVCYTRPDVAETEQRLPAPT